MVLESQLPHETVNLLFWLVIVNNKEMMLWGSWLCKTISWMYSVRWNLTPPLFGGMIPPLAAGFCLHGRVPKHGWSQIWSPLSLAGRILPLWASGRASEPPSLWWQDSSFIGECKSMAWTPLSPAAGFYLNGRLQEHCGRRARGSDLWRFVWYIYIYICVYIYMYICIDR